MRDSYPDMEKPAHFDPSRFQVDEIKLFSPMEFEPKDIVGYLRTGGCTAGCGACCEAFVIPLAPEVRESAGGEFQDVHCHRVQVPVDPIVVGKPGFEDWERWLDLHDAELLESASGMLTADLPVECEEAPGPMTTDEWFAWLEKQGVTLIRRDQQVLAYITRKCDEVGEDGQCQVFGTFKRPKMCGEYPRHPSDIWGLGFCTYKFTPVNRTEVLARSLVGQGRPQPQRKKKDKRKKRGRR